MTLDGVQADDPEALAMFREAMKSERGGDHTTQEGKTKAKGNNVTDCSTGNSRAYSISRVQKECDEETVAAVMAKEISPHAALVKAGVLRKLLIYPFLQSFWMDFPSSADLLGRNFLLLRHHVDLLL